MNSLNVNHQEKSSNQLAFHLSDYTHLWKSDISEAYKIQVDCLKDSDFYDKNAMKEKVNDLVSLHEAMQEKLKTASYSEQIQVFTLVTNGLECTVQNILMSLNTLFQLHMKLKK